jgi:H/ACA ribonucleoprotein complex non-core subunit NAF1
VKEVLVVPSDDSSESESDDEIFALIGGTTTVPSPKPHGEEGDTDDADTEDEGDGAKTATAVAGAKGPRTKNEIPHDALPPPEPCPDKLGPEDPAVEIGEVSSVVDNLVVVQASEGGGRTADEGSMLCFEDRTVIGRIDEVFGPVPRPLYTVRFAPGCALDPARFAKGAKVLLAVRDAQFVAVDQIRAKGSDASGLHDEEPPPEDIEYSDDEEEALAKKRARLEKKGLDVPQSQQVQQPQPRSRPRPVQHQALPQTSFAPQTSSLLQQPSTAAILATL